MSTQVQRRIRKERTTFGKLPIGALYWDSDNLTTAPDTKHSLTALLGGVTAATGVPTATAVTPKTAACVKVPRGFIGSRMH